MARDHGPPTPEDEFPSRGDAPVEPDDFDGRLLALDTEEESPFLRGQKRVPARRGALPRKAAHRLKFAVIAALMLIGLGLLAGMMYRYGSHSWRFRLESSDAITISGIEHVSRAQVVEVLGGDIGRNVFFIPLAERKKQLEEIPWVESAAVMRLLPNRVKVQIRERTPVAFLQIGSRIALIDRSGAVMELPPGGARKYSFPVIVGAGEQAPLSSRAAQMKIYDTLIRELDSEGGHYSQDLSEVNLADPEDVKITVANGGSEVLVHLGSSRFLDRYKLFVTHVQEWRQKYPQLDSVDLRYERQVVVNPDSAARATPAPVPPKPAPAPPKRAPAAAKKPPLRRWVRR